MYSTDKAGQILTLALEIEGLALLIQRRGDLVNPEVNFILRDKASNLLELTKSIVGEPNGGEASVVVDSEPDMPVVGHDGLTEECVEAEPIDEKASVMTIESEPEADNVGCGEGRMDGQASSDDMAVADSAIAEEVADSSDDIVANRKAGRHAADSDAVTAYASMPAAGQPVFTLNDRFRFIRELFKGSSQDFNDTLRLVSSMSSADEVVEYLSDDLCLDPENPDVVDFTAIVTQRFH